MAEALKVDMPECFWTYDYLAICYGQLGRKQGAKAAVDKLLGLYPEFASNYWRLPRRYNIPDDDAELQADGPRKAGLDIPPNTK